MGSRKKVGKIFKNKRMDKKEILKKIEEEIEKTKQCKEEIKRKKLYAEIEGERVEYYNYLLDDLNGTIRGLLKAWVIVHESD